MNAKNFLKKIDELKFNSVAQGLSESFVEDYKLPLLQEYKDKLLVMDTYSEGDAVKISDDFAPHAKKNGKILTKGAVNGTYRVKFEDGEYDIPEHHISRKDALATEEKIPDAHSGEKKKIHDMITEQKHIAIMADGSIVPVLLESIIDADEIVSEELHKNVLVVFPEVISESFMSNVNKELSDEQKDKREEIVLAMKNNKDELEKRYGNKWESVMHAIATKKALNESFVGASENVVFKKKIDHYTVMIVRDGKYFRMKRLDSKGNPFDVQEFNNFTDAENAAINYL
jgi:hypothetical protein